MADPGELVDALADWLPRQRWYGGKGRPISALAVETTDRLRPGDPELDIVIVRVDYARAAPQPDLRSAAGAAASSDAAGAEAAGSEHYQLLLGQRRELPQQLVHAAIGELSDGWAYDAVYDTEVTGELVAAIVDARHAGTLTFSREDDASLDATLPARVMGGEQSNTSLVYGDEYILKLFRKLAPGVNPDLEVTRALARAGCEYIAPPLGWFEGRLGDEPITLAMLQPFFKTGSDGWALASISVRDLYAEADLHADEVGGDFAAESERLGNATAVVHDQLAEVFSGREAGPEESAATAQQMNERLSEAVSAVPGLASHQSALRSIYDELGRRTAPVPVQRVHGDYHLGQVLRTESGWVLLDFEGEPARPLAERTALMSPLRDVAGMLRSFDYAARHLLADHRGEANLAYRAGEWSKRNRGAFCDGYAQASGRDPRAEPLLLRAFELDKAVYEVVYEARNRPSWLSIPLGSIERLVG